MKAKLFYLVASLFLLGCEKEQVERSPNGVYTKSEVELIMAAHLSGFRSAINQCDDKQIPYENYKEDSLRIVKILWK